MSKASEMHIELQDYLINVANKVEEGELSNLDGLIELRKNKEELEKSLEIIKEFESNRINQIANEAAEYPKGYKGFKITQVSGKKMYKFDNCPIVTQLDQKKKDAENFYKSGFEGFQKGTVQGKEVDGVWMWIDGDGDLQPFPEMNVGKSFLQIKEIKNNL